MRVCVMCVHTVCMYVCMYVYLVYGVHTMEKRWVFSGHVEMASFLWSGVGAGWMDGWIEGFDCGEKVEKKRFRMFGGREGERVSDGCLWISSSFRMVQFVACLPACLLACLFIYIYISSSIYHYNIHARIR